MKKTIVKSTLASLGAAAILTSCGPSLTALKKVNPLQNNISNMPEKTASLDKEALKSWPFMGMRADTVPGMSVKKAYHKIIKDNEGETVVVAVLDAGVDIFHEDLDGVIWTNKDEIPDNGIDDDNNGYVDDVHGWNFLGDMVHGTLNFTRILRELKPKYDGKTAEDISPENKAEYALYQRAQKEYDKQYSQAKRGLKRMEAIKEGFSKTLAMLAEEMSHDNFTKEQLVAANFDDDKLNMVKNRVLKAMERSEATTKEELYTEFSEQIQGGVDYYTKKLKYYLNLDYHGRDLVGDNPDDLSDRDYGDHRVWGPTEDKEDVMHGTHVAGIIAAERHNGIGMNGVSGNVKIMAIRAVPDGDEFDKDIALGIRYAVDNGAKIINMSFGKSFSSHSDWVYDAIKYAAKHDVLLVHAAGNDGMYLDKDTSYNYPNDQKHEATQEFVDNFITVGALNYQYGENLMASFSNYGKVNVDVFAPGVQIWSTVPNNKYEFLQGTSMAAPEVSGVAAVIWSYFPDLTAAQVKDVIMKSGLMTTKEVSIGQDETKPFNELSKSGKIVNLYNALIMASKL